MGGICNPWEIWIARVKFEDSDEIKNRPVLILENGQAFILALKITSHCPREYCSGEYKVTNWEKSGLDRQSTVRCSKRLRLIESDLVHRIGRLHPYDIMMLQELVAAA